VDLFVFKRQCVWILFAATSVFLSACATLNPTKVHHINDLASAQTNTGSFKGIEAMAQPVQGDIKRVNIIYIHGIGWTENADTPELGNSFLRGIASAYEGVDQENFVVNRCRLSHHDTSEGELDHTFIETAQDIYYETGLKGSAIKLKKLACMDKQVLRTSSNYEFVVYRVFWDDTFWNGLQSPHVGYDDAFGYNANIAPLRKKFNRKFKDDIVNYGFSDAVMYLGPAGELIREAIEGAICSAARDASGTSLAQQGHIVTKATACAPDNIDAVTAPFVFVTESLGSKIIFDVLHETMNDQRGDIIDELVDGSEIYMLANQIPLLSLSNLSVNPARTHTPYTAPSRTAKVRPRIVALTELNDFLSYELVPFYETLYGRTYDLRHDGEKRTPDMLNMEGARAHMIEDIGFDIVDLRVEFADPLIPIIKSLVDPKQAHSDHAKQPLLMRYLLCGAQKGQLRTQNCTAALIKK
jgi:hypothetical protein